MADSSIARLLGSRHSVCRLQGGNRARRECKVQRETMVLKVFRASRESRVTKVTLGPSMIVAMGFIVGNGTINERYNITDCKWNSTDKWYEITLAGINYDFPHYVTPVAPAGSENVAADCHGTAGKLIVIMHSADTGAPTMCSFSFTVFECPDYG